MEEQHTVTHANRITFLEERIAQLSRQSDDLMREIMAANAYAALRSREAGYMRGILALLIDAETTADLRQARSDAIALLRDLDG